MNPTFKLKVTRLVAGKEESDFVRTKYGKIREMNQQELDEELSNQNRIMYQWESELPTLEVQSC